MKICFLLLLLTGCTSLAPEYTRPTPLIPTGWDFFNNSQQENDISLDTQQGKASRETSWKNYFKSPELQKIVEAAISYNHSLRIAVLNVQSARALYQIDFANLLPRAGISMEGSKQSMANMTAYKANITPTFELDLFGRLQSENDGALESYFATESARDAAQIILIAETANAYIQWLADNKILHIKEDILKNKQKFYDIMKQNYHNGVADDVMLAEASSALETARGDHAQYTRHVQEDENAILLLIGQKNKELVISKNLDHLEIIKNLPEGLSSSILLERPDIVQQEHKLKAANAHIGAARAAFFPKISLTGTYGFMSSSLANLFSSSSGGAWSFTPQLSLPIFEGGANMANLELSEIRKEIAIIQYEELVERAFREVANALLTTQELNTQKNAHRQLVKDQEKTCNIISMGYKLGIESLLKYLQAEYELHLVQIKFIDVQKKSFMNIVNLYKVLGL
ncbi:MAG: multidrug transporter [Alphaproteobacteria bacterium CG_4_10_14_0_8_um_filter_37_21]|nr:MAG: multidrug transporter [Alphaproteobacteria bacterium CG_4_10_14_0_8_um_filter_37_21]